jgi:hypothetical protein
MSTTPLRTQNYKPSGQAVKRYILLRCQWCPKCVFTKAVRTAISLFSIYSVVASQILFESVRGRRVNIYAYAVAFCCVPLERVIRGTIKEEAIP